MNRKSGNLAGVTIVTCTTRPQLFGNVLRNYFSQQYAIKQLIIVINNDAMALDKYRKITSSLAAVSVFKVPERETLGRCLNLAIGMAKYPFIAKFDDDDYYSPYYLIEQMKAIRRTGADVVGKRSYLTYLNSKKILVLRFPGQNNRFTGRVAGGTLLIKRKVFNNVRFSNMTLGEDVNYLRKCRAKGYRIYAASPYNYVAIRRKNKLSHTWTAGDNQQLKGSRIVARTNQFRAYAIRRP